MLSRGRRDALQGAGARAGAVGGSGGAGDESPAGSSDGWETHASPTRRTAVPRLILPKWRVIWLGTLSQLTQAWPTFGS